jgi:hypothetical protein
MRTVAAAGRISDSQPKRSDVKAYPLPQPALAAKLPRIRPFAGSAVLGGRYQKLEKLGLKGLTLPRWGGKPQTTLSRDGRRFGHRWPSFCSNGASARPEPVA